MIQAIIFDCFGVLTGDAWKAFVHSLPEKQRDPARELNRAMDKGQLPFEEFSRLIAELTGRPENEVKRVINAEATKNTTLFSYIAELKKSYKIGLLSNVSSDWITRVFLTKDETALFDQKVFSYEVGLIKPDPAIYKLIAERLGVELADCVMVDDSPRQAAGAEQVGMKTILYQDFDQFKAELEKLLANSNN